MDVSTLPGSDAGAATASAERAFLSDARVAVGVLNWARHQVLTRTFGVSRSQVNLLTFVLALSAADATYGVARRVIRHPWPLSGIDTLIGFAYVRKAGFAIAGPRLREVKWFGALIAVAGVGRLVAPGLRRELHELHVVEQRVGKERMGFWGAEQPAAVPLHAAG